MGFRFRRSVRLFPGVRLNFSRSGISTTVGVRGATVTMGPRGSHLNVGIPGTGLSFQQPLTPTLTPLRTTGPRPSSIPSPVPSNQMPLGPPPAIARLAGEITSAPNQQLTSVSLRELRDLLAEAYQESQRLKSQIPEADQEVHTTQIRAFKWGKGLVLRHLFKAKYATIIGNFTIAKSEREALDAEIEKCRIALEIEMEGGIDTSYGNLVESFAALAACERCWDNIAALPADQFRERTSANHTIVRRPVVLDLRPADVIAPSRPALHFQNANGGDLYILPGLLLVLGDQRDFALIRLTEVRISHESTQFFEEDSVPADCQIVGETWKKVNKDGSPDRRFSINYPIPIVRYGLIRFTSAAGLNEEFMFSSDPKTQVFAASFAKHRATLPIT